MIDKTRAWNDCKNKKVDPEKGFIKIPENSKNENYAKDPKKPLKKKKISRGIKIQRKFLPKSFYINK